MTRDAAVVVAVVCVALGWYGRKWVQAEDDETGAKAKADAAGKAAWRARLVLAGVVLVAIGVIDVWFRAR